MRVGEEDLIDAIGASVTLVAVSAVQSVSEHITDLQALKQRTKQTGAMVAVDATQAAGWLPLS
ncbi:aminotransferase class V-fold PLP-dependent enzyme [Ferrimicrobium sp.]|uniref:aminotransferase class V-fold PLP-dependent enzyme n=1 Tax=Ferrimicrobium sp. TaxID=2926050 RepID=UPI00260C117D|nr:aminotransferase class V-fold PLP-dependent enzyme [Ferrimicrobium sp.]